MRTSDYPLEWGSGLRSGTADRQYNGGCAMALRLVPASGTPIDVPRDQIIVGREPSCDIVLQDGSVSRKHARLEKQGEQWKVVDNGSANGTYIDGTRIAEQVLKNGQELRFGAVAFKVELE